MNRAKAIEILKGKIIEDVDYAGFMDWFTIHSIKFTDGTVLNLEGNDEYAKISSIDINGESIDIDEE